MGESPNLSRRTFARSGAALSALATAGLGSAAQAAATVWDIRPSLAYDALCFLGPLSGDAFYLQAYRAEVAAFSPSLGDPARAAVGRVKRRIKDEAGGIVSAFLCLHFSAGSPETLDDLIRLAAAPGPMEAALKASAYYNRGGWRMFLAAQGDLRTALAGLKAAGFAEYWRETVLPDVEGRMASSRAELAAYDVVAEDERALGRPLPSPRITAYMLHFNQPHGIRLTGQRFVSAARWPLRVLVNNAVHELLHPPYDLAGDKGVREAVRSLGRDAFLIGKVTGHNVSFGYNSLEGLVEEDCVRALDQLVMERLGLAIDPRERWRSEDEGLHVFAAALHAAMRADGFPRAGEGFRDYLVRAITSGRLGAGRIEAAAKAAMS